MSTDWLPLKTIDFDEFKKDLPEGLTFHDANNDSNFNFQYDYNKAFVITNGKSYLHVYRTKINGCCFEQFGKNQNDGTIFEPIKKKYGTKVLSYIGQPYDDLELAEIDYNDLHKREYLN